MEGVRLLQEQRERASYECNAVKPSNGRCDLEEMRKAYHVIVENDLPASINLEGMSAWSFTVLHEIKPKVFDRLFDGMEEARLERWTSVGPAKQVCDQVGKRGGPLVHGMFANAEGRHRLVPGQRQRALSDAHIPCGFCEGESKAQEMTCVVPMQCGHTADSCLVFLAGSPPLGRCKNFVEAVTMANHARELVDKVRASEGLSGCTLESLAHVRHEWSGGAMEPVLQWQQVEAQTVVKRVHSP